MTTLADFLLARIADDEATASGLINNGRGNSPTDRRERNMGSHLLAECDSKRRIVAKADEDPGSDGGFVDGWYAMGHEVLRLLALPYADHPEFREEWRV